jgi:ABC-type uncharacterized transport system permease subunit
MSVVLTPDQVAAPPPPPGTTPAGQRAVLWILVVLFALATTRVITGADDIGSAGTMRAALIAAVPIALAGLGGLWSERAGVINIGLEGMMILGTLGAGYYGYHWGVWAGILGAAMFGLIGGVLHAVATVVFGVDHIVSGVAINIIAAGIARFLAEAWFSDLEGGGPTQSPSLDSPPTITVPGLSDWSADLADKEWYLISDAGAMVNALVEDMSVFTLLALGLIFGTGWLLWKTAFGLRLRSCGENPVSAETLGVNVYRYKFIAVSMSGVFAGLGGGYLAMVASSGYQNDMTNGRGYIGLAAMIFGNWRPGGLLTGSLLFGYTDAARLRSGGESIHALMLILAVGLIVLAIWQWRRQQRVMAAVTAGIGIVSGLVYLLTDEIPGDFTEMAPYIATMLVLALASQRLRVPAADGMRYRRGEAT